ncbi:MAG: OmpA family protein [Burkholderiaceae bacterium]|nr:OmpA family protein [Burkholderiaceae bacterium]
MRRHRLTPFVALLAIGLAAVNGHAAEPLLKPGQITESALVDALTPADEAKTRSIRPTLTGAAPSAQAAGRAGLLITFQTGSAELTPETRTALDEVGKALKSDRLAGFSFRIEGHADPRGGVDYNLRLSEERAQSVVAYLMDRYGLPADRLQPVGKGSSELLNAQQPTAPENRRVTIVTTR